MVKRWRVFSIYRVFRLEPNKLEFSCKIQAGFTILEEIRRSHSNCIPEAKHGFDLEFHSTFLFFFFLNYWGLFFLSEKKYMFVKVILKLRAQAKDKKGKKFLKNIYIFSSILRKTHRVGLYLACVPHSQPKHRTSLYLLWYLTWTETIPQRALKIQQSVHLLRLKQP